MKKEYILIDNEGEPIKAFKTYTGADTFRNAHNRPDWRIEYKYYYIPIKRKSTEKQKSAVRFCESWLNIDFEGNIDNFDEVSRWLSVYLEDAKSIYEEVQADYEAYLWSKL